MVGRKAMEEMKAMVRETIINNKSEDDDGSRAVFDDVDCFRSKG